MTGTPAVLASAVVTTGLATIEAATGICVPMFVWGAVGGLWAFWYLEPMRAGERVLSLFIAALVASVTTKPLAMVAISAASNFLPWWPVLVDYRSAAWPIAIMIGLLCHTVIGKKLIAIANRAADEVAK